MTVHHHWCPAISGFTSRFPIRPCLPPFSSVWNILDLPRYLSIMLYLLLPTLFLPFTIPSSDCYSPTNPPNHKLVSGDFIVPYHYSQVDNCPILRGLGFFSWSSSLLLTSTPSRSTQHLLTLPSVNIITAWVLSNSQYYLSSNLYVQSEPVWCF